MSPQGRGARLIIGITMGALSFLDRFYLARPPLPGPTRRRPTIKDDRRFSIDPTPASKEPPSRSP